jgi:DnaJ-class molecular chaperone
LRILGLREGATEGEGKAAYRAMSRIYHPDKHNSGFTGKSDEEAVEFFQHLITNTEERKKYERTNNDL